MIILLSVMCIIPLCAYAQTEPAYTIHIPDTMIRGETYRGIIIYQIPPDTDRTFHLASPSGDITIQEAAIVQAGTNHAMFDIYPEQSTILSGTIQTTLTVIPPDGNIQDIKVETHPGVGVISRLWMVGPGAEGAGCSTPDSTTTQEITDRAAEGIFEVYTPENTVRTRLNMASVYIFLTDRYCTPSVAPQGGVAITVTSDSPDVTFGTDTPHTTGVIPQGYNAAILDVYLQPGAEGVLYGSGKGVISDAIRVVNEPDIVSVHLGVGPSVAMESSYVTYHVWLEQGGEQYIPDRPISVYMVTDNPVLASFDRTLVDSSGPAIHKIRPHHTFLKDGVATGIIHTGTPATVGDLRLLAGTRDITVTAHVQGIGSATAEFTVGKPIDDQEITLQAEQLQECISEQIEYPQGAYPQQCTDAWQRLLLAAHFFDIRAADGNAPDTPKETIALLDAVFGGDNTQSGNALFELTSRLNEHSFEPNYVDNFRHELTKLLNTYLGTTDAGVDIPEQDEGIVADMLDRVPVDPPPNRVVAEAFPSVLGMASLVVSTTHDEIPVYMPDGVITLSSDSGLYHDAEVPTFGSTHRQEAPGTRPSAVVIPVQIRGGGTITASLGGVGSDTIKITDIYPEQGRQLHVSPLPGSGERDIIAILSVLQDGAVVQHNGPVHIAPGQGVSDITLDEWRGGAGAIRGLVNGVGEIIIHAPNVGAGVALTTPVRYEADLALWYPDTVHVSEEFPFVAHTLDAGQNPIRKVDVELSGDIAISGTGVELEAPGEVPVIVRYGSIYKAGTIEGFLNTADIAVTPSADIVELDDVVILRVDTGAMTQPYISISGGPLSFIGERDRWEAPASVAGTHNVEISVTQPGWEPIHQTVQVRVSHLLELNYDAVTVHGVLVDATVTVCGKVIPRGLAQIEPGLCSVEVQPQIVVDGISHKLDTLYVNDVQIQNGATIQFDSDTSITATYVGSVTIEITYETPDGIGGELHYMSYRPGDTVLVEVPSEYHWWGLVWDRPAQYTGIPANALYTQQTLQFTADTDVFGVIQYERDYTYLIMLGAAGPTIPIVYMYRARIKGLRFKR